MRRHKGNRLVLILTLILIAFGMIMIYIIGPLRAQQLGEANESAYFIGQIKAVAVSLVLFFLSWKVFSKNIKLLDIAPKILMALALLSCAALWVGGNAGMGFVSCQLGGCRWFSVAGFSFQPAELVKLATVLLSAQYFAELRNKGHFKPGRKSSIKVAWEMVRKYGLSKDAAKRIWALVKRPLFDYWIWIIMSIAFVVIAQKDMGSAVPIAAIVFSAMIVSGMPMKVTVTMIAAIVAVFLLTIVTSPHRMDRVRTLLGGEGNDYHAHNALIAVGSGGLAGVGVGNSVQAAGYLPESINDSIFAAIGEMFGLLGTTALLMAFFMLFMNIMRIGDQSQDLRNKLIVDGIVAWMAAQVMTNVASMIGLIPLTGVTLPLISYGGSSMMIVSVALGIVMAISEYTGRRNISETERDGNIKNPVFGTVRRRRV